MQYEYAIMFLALLDSEKRYLEISDTNIFSEFKEKLTKIVLFCCLILEKVSE